MKIRDEGILTAVNSKPVLEMLAADFREAIEVETDEGRRSVLESVLSGIAHHLHDPKGLDVTVEDAVECRNRFIPYKPTAEDLAEFAEWSASVKP